MKPILGYFSTQIAKTRTIRRAKPFITCRLLLILLTLGVGALMGTSLSSNKVVNAQLEDTGEIREEQRAREIEEEFPSEQDQDDKEAGTTTDSHELSLTLERAHFIPLSPLSDSPGNQVKMLLDYTIEDPPALADDDTTVSAIMEVYAENQTLLRTSSLPEPIVIDDDSEGTIQLAHFR